jgi:hypothetical protein
MRKSIHSTINLQNKTIGIYPFEREYKLEDNVIITNAVVYNTQSIKTDTKDELLFYIGGTNKSYKEDIQSWCGSTSNNPGPLTTDQINHSQVNYYGREPVGSDSLRNYLGLQIKQLENKHWATQISGSYRVVYSCSDPLGLYTYLVGIYDRDIYFYNKPGDVYAGVHFENSDGLYKTFVAKYDTEGELVWANYITSTVEVEGTSIASDRNGNIYVCGTYIGSLSFFDMNETAQPISFPSVLEEYTFIVQYSGDNGNLIWGTRMGPSIAISMYCNIYDELFVSGYFVAEHMDIYNIPGTNFEVALQNDSGISSFITKYGPEGNLYWASRIDGLQNKVKDIIGDLDGSIYLTGLYMNDTLIPGNAILKAYNQSGQDINYSEIFLPIDGIMASFIVKLNRMGHVLWANRIDGFSNSNSGIISCTIDTKNNLYVTGNFTNKLFIYNNIYTKIAVLVNGGSNSDVFIVKYNSDGKYIWANSVTNTKDKNIYSIVCDGEDNPYICGSVDMGSFQNSFVVKYNSNGINQWYSDIKGNGNCVSVGVSVDNKNNLYVVGWYNSETLSVERNEGGVTMTNMDINGSGFLIKYIKEQSKKIKIIRGNVHVLLELELYTRP